ncbi:MULTISPECIES: hypothetical protein [Protofrankia]|uniref:Uncharacterized protein n=1 Tax=Candidatus Protofrankia californiensis TaxID=1839754 RepID=A0A1C3NY70_9ACTN|nr:MULTISPECIES: hypothetical protein [Protofrankia]SBW22487.1 hypothetical protein FDG2_2711 [Candidatus Protofrankia californiensis]
MEQVLVGGDGLTLLMCPQCGDERGFEQPPCCDGHGADCPDRACVDCGTAVCVNPGQADFPAPRARVEVPGPSGGSPLQQQLCHVA